MTIITDGALVASQSELRSEVQLLILSDNLHWHTFPPTSEGADLSDQRDSLPVSHTQRCSVGTCLSCSISDLLLLGF